MAEAKAVQAAPPAPRLLAVTLTRSVGLNSVDQAYYPATKFELEVVERGDVKISMKGGRRYLVVPKGLAFLEYGE